MENTERDDGEVNEVNESDEVNEREDGQVGGEVVSTGASKSKNKGKKLSKNKQKAIEKELQRHDAIRKLFSDFYSKQVDTKRWPTLLESMKKPFRYCCFINRFANPDSYQNELREVPRLNYVSLPCYSPAYNENVISPFPQPSADMDNIMNYYSLDASSVLVTEALDIKPTDNILDMCAAPGGKSLAIMQRLFLRESNGTLVKSREGSIVCNDISPPRRKRLQKIVDTYIPRDLRENIIITGRDATKQNTFNNNFDKILLDAPCSSERHLLHDEKELLTWGQSRSRNNAKKQLLLLHNALLSVKVDGIVVYATCSISKLENDGVISKLLKKSSIDVKVEKRKWDIGESTEHGWFILPDRDEGWGPLYFAILRRLPKNQTDDSNTK